jgi:hypothetical protein
MREVEITIRLVGTEGDAAEVVELLRFISDRVKKESEESEDDDN